MRHARSQRLDTRPSRLSGPDLVRFELTVALPVGLRILYRRLGARATTAALLHLARSARRDPFASITSEHWDRSQEQVVRRHLGAALRLDDALVRLVDASERSAIISEIVAEVGARFVERAVSMPAKASWAHADQRERESFARRVSENFPNIAPESTEVEVSPEELILRIRRCRFAELCRELGRPHLAKMFCAADARFVDRSERPIRLTRERTLAKGDSSCDFYFRLT